MKYRDLCDFETRKVPVANGRRFVVLCQIKPKDQIIESNKAYIYGHQGGGLMYEFETFVLEGCRTAVLFRSQVFLVDFWKEGNKAPTGAKDFAESIEYINNNSTKFGIHKDHLCVGGAGAGGWVLLGALMELIKRNNVDIIEAAFFISPIVDDVIGKTNQRDLAFWEKKWANYTKGFFELMATDYDK